MPRQRSQRTDANHRGASLLPWATGLAGVLLAAVALAQEPRDWLARADQALAVRNYRGIFVHEHAGESETLRVIHRVSPEGVAERLVSMDGSGREFIRKGNQLICYLPDEHTVLVEQSPDERLLLTTLPRLDPAAAGQYDIHDLGRVRVSGRDARLISIAPLDALRYGYRVWIDEATAMPLKMQLRDRRGAVLEQLVFTNLDLPTHIAEGELEPAVDARGYHWIQREADTVDTRGLSVSWQAEALPPGFRMTASARQVLPGGPVEHLVFSDGLASVSVFIEMARSGAAGFSEDDEASLGSSSAYSTAVQGYRVTAVGEVPAQTVRAIAQSIRTTGPAPSLVESEADARELLPPGTELAAPLQASPAGRYGLGSAGAAWRGDAASPAGMPAGSPGGWGARAPERQ